ncbi:MAG: hypothetical protein R2729_11005 [Bryobacteraceae bacterium]
MKVIIRPGANGIDSSRLREMLERRGGLYSLYGEFLRHRADLLRSDQLSVIARMARPRWRIERAEMAALLREGCGAAGAEATESLSSEPCRTAPLSCTYHTRYRGRTVAIQAVRPEPSPGQFAALEGGLREWSEGEALGPLVDAALEGFGSWLDAGSAAARRARVLEAVRESPLDGLVVFPAPVPELSSARLVSYEWVDGEGLEERIRVGDAEAIRLFAEAQFELLCLYQIVDADLDPSSMVVTPQGRVAFCFPPRAIPVPPKHRGHAMKYVSCGIAGDTPAAARALLIMADSNDGEQDGMIDALAAIEPDLKLDATYPRSSVTFENLWRALALLEDSRPLWVDCMHRNLNAIGQWTAASASAAGSGQGEDILERAYWPVLGRFVRNRLGRLMSRETASEWLLSTGLLAVEGMRQANRVAEEIRDDELSFRLHVSARAGGESSAENDGDRSTVLLLAAGALLVTFLLCLRWGPVASGAASIALGAGALAAAAALFAVVFHID